MTVPIHIRYEIESDKLEETQERANVGGTLEHKGTFSIAPRFGGKLRHIGGDRLYDVRAIMRRWGLALPEGSFALFNPDAQLLFVRSTPADLELADACVEPRPRLTQAISFDVQIMAKSAARAEQKLFSGKSIGTESGARTELSSAGGAGENAHKIDLAVEPANDRSGIRVLVNLEGSISLGSSQNRIATSLAAEFDKEVETELSLGGDTEVILRFTFRQKVLGKPAELESEETAKQAIAEIEADLLKVTETHP